MTALPIEVRYTGLPPAQPLPFPATTGAVALLTNGAGIVVGWAVEETTGLNVARVVIGDGNAAAITRAIVPITLQASESSRDFPPNGGIMFQQGLAVQITAGTVAGVLHAVLLSPDEFRELSVIRLPAQG